MACEPSDLPDRREVRARVFSSVNALGDLEFQRATWLDPEMQNPHFTFVEFVECFYDACWGDHHEREKDAHLAPFTPLLRESMITVAERDALWAVHMALCDYHEPEGPYGHAAILNDPAWFEVVKVANQAGQAIKAGIEESDDPSAFENRMPTPNMKRWP